ncbi:MAG: hypothetical protein U9Q40_01035 [Campylobacterota bacterium]|nr:hypothetical protein [Campylobacterota bacterium]
MEIFLKYKIVFMRSLGGLMLLIGFATHFWATPKEGISANERAAANIARMEAKVSGKSAPQSQSSKKSDSKFLDDLKDTQAKQLQYLTIIAMILGIGFLGYSFMPKRDSKSSLE